MIVDQRSSGIVLHLASLPGPHGAGDCGPEAWRFVDWLAAAGQRLWQLLPPLPLASGDPYQGSSAFAASPLLVALEPFVERGWLERIDPMAPQVDPQRVDFARVVPWRMAQLRAAADGFFKLAQPNERAGFARWCKAEAGWLDDHAMFMAIEAVHPGQPWWRWEPALARRDAPALHAFAGRHAADLAFWRFVQWSVDSQWSVLRERARSRGVKIVVDLPFSVARHSVDCWTRPDLFHLGDDAGQPTVVAGMVPDRVGAAGERGCTPVYDWQRMAAEGHAWWVARIRRCLQHADLIRLEHFRGFAAGAEVPAAGPTAGQGRWAAGPGRALFDGLRRELGGLPFLVDDRGVIAPDVDALRDECGLPGMRLLQCAFDGDAGHCGLPHNYPANAVVQTGCGDGDTVQGWWQAAPAPVRDYVAAYLGRIDEREIHWDLIRLASNSVASIALFPLQDVLGLDGSRLTDATDPLADRERAWRFDWSMLGDAGPKLARIAAASGRAPFALLAGPAG